jgi:hypothetical protein
VPIDATVVEDTVTEWATDENQVEAFCVRIQHLVGDVGVPAADVLCEFGGF